MVEFRIHGRSGQSNVSAAYWLATTAFENKRMCQAIRSFEAERRVDAIGLSSKIIV